MQSECLSLQEQFLATVRRFAALRTQTPDYRFYETWKAQALRDFPHLNGREYDDLVGEIARLAGV